MKEGVLIHLEFVTADLCSGLTVPSVVFPKVWVIEVTYFWSLGTFAGMQSLGLTV